MKAILPLVFCFVTSAVRADDEFREFKGHTGPTRVVHFTPDGTKLVSSSGWPEGDKTLRVWDVKTGKELLVLKGHTNNIDYISLSADGKRAYSASHDATVRGWDLDTGKEVVKFTGHGKSGAGSVATSPDGKIAASGDGESHLFLWDTTTGKLIRELKGHKKNVRSLAFSPDGKSLYSGSWDGTIRQWDVSSGKEIKVIKPETKRVENFVLFDKGKKLLIACDKVSLWDVENNEIIRSYEGQGQWGIITIAVSPDGKKLAMGGYDGVMRVRNVESGEVIGEFKAHIGHCNWTAFSPDGKWVATAGGGSMKDGKGVKGTDFMVRLWKLDE